MLKVLIKKQLIELFRGLFINRRNGKKRSTISIVGMVLLMVLVFVSFGSMFMGLSFLLADALLNSGMFMPHTYDWLYFSMMSIITITLGTVGSAFVTYSTLYQSKDNELLLSMPIKPSAILISRMVSVFLMSMLYSAAVWIPTVLQYWIHVIPTVTSIIFSIMMLLMIPMVVSVFACVLGYGVAAVSSKVKNKNFVTVLASLVFLGLYYFVCIKMNDLMNQFVANAFAFSSTVQKWILPIFWLGNASSGEVIEMLKFTVFVLALFILCCSVLSRNYVKILTTQHSVIKGSAKVKDAQKQSVQKALYLRELKMFLNNPTYLLNCGMGLVFLIVLAVYMIVKADSAVALLQMIESVSSGLSKMVPVVIVGMICMLVSTNGISTPSLSLEGKNLWILRSLPVSSKDVLNMKAYFHISLNLPIALLATAACVYVLQFDTLYMTLAFLDVIAYVMFTGYFGMVLGTKWVNVNWTNAVVVIKQGMPIFVYLFGGWVLAIGSIALYYFIGEYVSVEMYMAVFFAVFTLARRYSQRWLNSRGVEVYESI